MRGAGGYNIVGKTIYVYGVVDNKRVRLSTNKEANSLNINWIKKNYQQVLLKLIAEKNNSQIFSLNLIDFAEEVLEITKSKRNKHSQKDYLSKLENYIKPFFKSYTLKDIKAFDIERWQAQLLMKYSTVTVKKTRCILNLVLEKAVANDMITKNPVKYSDTIKVIHTKQIPYSLREMKSILKNSKGWLNVFLNLAFSTGLRTGELMALKWEDFDLDRSVLYLKRSISKGKITDVQTSSTTKNHYRLVILPKFVVNILKEYYFQSSNVWLFPSRLGKPYTESKSIVRYFKPLLKSLNIEYKTLYATRHTYISLMRNNGVSADIVTEIVGHSKEIEDKHYLTESINMHKVNTINDVFEKLGHS